MTTADHDTPLKMTILEAEQILDIVSTALREKSLHNFHPISSLKGYDVFKIDAALKLRIANEFLILAEMPNFEEKFSEGIDLYDSIPFHIVTLFVPDNELEKLNRLPRDSSEYRKQNIAISPSPLNDSMDFKDERLASLETPSSFGDYCKNVGTKDKLYWQKIYTRIGLEYTSTSPRGNDPVPLSE